MKCISSNFCFLLISFCLIAQKSIAIDFGKVQSTFEIKEEKFSDMMKKKMIEKNHLGEMMAKKTKERINSPKSLKIAKCTKSRNFFVDPSFELKSDIKDNFDNILFKAGTKVNPLDHVKLDSDIVLIDGSDLEQVKWYQKNYGNKNERQDVLILVGGSPVEMTKKLNKEVYFDQLSEWVNRFKVSFVPTILRQVDKKIKVFEVDVNA